MGSGLNRPEAKAATSVMCGMCDEIIYGSWKTCLMNTVIRIFGINVVSEKYISSFKASSINYLNN